MQATLEFLSDIALPHFMQPKQQKFEGICDQLSHLAMEVYEGLASHHANKQFCKDVGRVDRESPFPYS
jgi:hypothetical protein